MAYLYLAIAIIAEIIATSFVRQADGFTKLIPSAICIIGYCITFYTFSLALRGLPTGIAYAIWAGVGVVLVAAIAWLFQGQKLDGAAIVGMSLIIAGVAILNLFSKVVAH